MGWFGFLKILLSLASTVANYLREKKLLDAGAQAETAKMLAEVVRRAGIADHVRAEIAGMSDADLDSELRGDK